MRILAVFNIKGGVGKTATAVNLGYLAAHEGLRTLLWDLDPQGAATFYFRIKPKVRGGGEKLILGKADLAAAIRGSDFEGLDVLPADFSYRLMGRALATAGEGRGRLRELLRPVEEDYDLCLIDCAPNLTEVSDRVFDGAGALLIPTIPTTLSLRTLAQLMKYLKKRDHRPRTMPFFSMVDRRKALHRRVCAYVRQEQLGFLGAEIPYASAVEQMGLRRSPLAAYAPSNPAARAYAELWDEIRLRLDADAVEETLLKKSHRKALERAIADRLDVDRTGR